MEMKKILIVDDEEPIRHLLKQILEAKGYHCTLAADASEARKCFKQETFDLILSDILPRLPFGLDHDLD